MLTEIYIEALLVDEKLADQVWEACLWGQFSLRNSANCAEIGGTWRMSAFPQSGHSDHRNLSEVRGRFRPQGALRLTQTTIRPADLFSWQPEILTNGHKRSLDLPSVTGRRD